MRHIFIIFATVVGLSGHSVSANADASAAKEFTEKLFSEDPNEVVKAYMRPEVLAFIGNNMRTTLSQIDGFTRSFGAVQGVDVVYEEALANRVKRVAVLIYLEVLPMSAEIYMYETEGKWWVNSFNFDSDMKYLKRKFSR